MYDFGKIFGSIDPKGCAIDMPAESSELLIIADDTANRYILPGFTFASRAWKRFSSNIFDRQIAC